MADGGDNWSLDDAETRWARVRERLREELGEAKFNSYIAPMTLLDAGGGRVELGVATRFLRDYARREFSESLLRLWRGEIPELLLVDVTTRAVGQATGTAAASSGLRPAALRAPSSAPARALNGPTVREGEPSKAGIRPLSLSNPTGLIPAFSFESFVVGPSNAVAFEAAKRVAESPGTRYNPLVLHSATGLGKTHLLHAIGNALLAANPGARVRYLSAERFLCLFLQAMRARDGLGFKDEFRGADLLLVDDFHYFASGGRETTQIEFMHTLSSLIGNNRQVVIAAEQAPAALQGIDHSMRARLASGMVLDIRENDYALRLGILRQLASRFEAQQAALKRAPVKFAADALPFLAERLATNGHELTGAFLRISGQADIMGVEVTIDFVHHVLKDQLHGANRPCSIEQIQQAVASYTGISVQDQRSKRRTQGIVLARHMAFWLCRELTEKSYPQIALRFGNRDHTTVIAGVRRINKLLETDAKLKADLEAIKVLLKK